MDNEGTFTQSQGVSLCLHLSHHVLINHVRFLHHLEGKDTVVTKLAVSLCRFDVVKGEID